MKMFNNNCKALLAAVTMLGLGACGGGDGGPGTGDTVTAPPPPPPPPPAQVSGTFVDAAVGGLGYIGNPSGTTGTTTAAGVFTVIQGDTVSFRIGNLVLGSTGIINNSGVIVTPATLTGTPSDATNPRAIRIAQVLQSLDADNDTSNGITINAAVASRLTDGTVDAAALQTAIETGSNFSTVFGGVVDDLTAGNAGRTEGDIVSAADAQTELEVAVSEATGGGGGGSGGTPIVAAATASCPIGIASNNRVAIFGQDFPICVITQNILSNVTLTNDHIYVLDKAINVGDGQDAGGPSGVNNVVLTLQEGTQLFGFTGLQTGLVITRGSRIEAVGTADLPIILAAVEATGSGTTLQITDDPADLSKRGQWAGLVLSGFGVNNQCGPQGSGNEVDTEAVPTGQQRFSGCNNNNDSSGTLEYVIIAESGLGFRPDQEVQGLTVEAAGSGTRINFLQVLGSEDDGVEWFGGAASASNLVMNGIDDDGLDMDEGYVGTIQNALVVMGALNGDKGIEADTAGPNDDAPPISRPNLLNLTILGNRGSGGTGVAAVNYKDGFGGAMWRSVMIDNPLAPAGSSGAFTAGCLNLADQIDQNVAFRDVLVECSNGLAVAGTLADGFLAGAADETGAAVSADRRDFTTIDGSAAINPNTLAISVAGQTPDNPVAPPPGINGNPVGNYFGAVDPNSGDPDNIPTNNTAGGGPFWDGWTYINSAVDGKLPGQDFHPLQAEIQAGQ